MERFDPCITTFEHAINRASQMVRLYDALTLLGSNDTNDDALRAAYFQAVSSFDFFMHEVVAVEGAFRLRNSIGTKSIMVPMDYVSQEKNEEFYRSLEAILRERNSYRSFVDPDKVSEALSSFCDNPWLHIHSKMRENFNFSPDASSLKLQLKTIWSRRNKIAHEADINPDLAGVGLWPISKQDTEITIEFLSQLAKCVPYAAVRVLQ